MVLIVFRSRLRPECLDEFQELAQEMEATAATMPGFVSYKVFAAEDGERCSVIEFETLRHLEAWRDLPRHREAQRLGRERYYESYSLQIGEPLRETRFERTEEKTA